MPNGFDRLDFSVVSNSLFKKVEYKRTVLLVPGNEDHLRLLKHGIKNVPTRNVLTSLCLRAEA